MPVASGPWMFVLVLLVLPPLQQIKSMTNLFFRLLNFCVLDKKHLHYLKKMQLERRKSEQKIQPTSEPFALTHVKEDKMKLFFYILIFNLQNENVKEL